MSDDTLLPAAVTHSTGPVSLADAITASIAAGMNRNSAELHLARGTFGSYMGQEKPVQELLAAIQHDIQETHINIGICNEIGRGEGIDVANRLAAMKAIAAFQGNLAKFEGLKLKLLTAAVAESKQQKPRNAPPPLTAHATVVESEQQPATGEVPP